MNNTINLSRFNSDSSRIPTILKDILKQVEVKDPFATENSEEVSISYEPLDSNTWRIIDKLHDKKAIAAAWNDSGYYELSFKPKILNQWITDNLIPKVTPNNPLPLPDGVEWNEEKCLLTLSDGKKIKLIKGNKNTSLFKIYIKNHGLYVSHNEVKKEDIRFNNDRIKHTINTLKRGRFRNRKDIVFETQKKSAYRILIKS